MEILGTHFSLTLGGWRLRFLLSIEEAEEAQQQSRSSAHHLVIKEPDAPGARR